MSSKPPFDCLTLDDMIDLIVTCQKRASKHTVPFTTLLGAGFSAPIIPTAREMVQSKIVRWIYQQEQANNEKSDSIDYEGEEFKTFEQELWEDIAKKWPGRGDPNLPKTEDQWGSAKGDTIGWAYQEVMSVSSPRGLSTAAMRRDYLRQVIKDAKAPINPAPIYLANILKEQDKDDVWKFRSPFCRTVFTTNFDPLLQRSLQLVNKLYYMSDRPETFEAPADDSGDAIHLVYTHGSVHRYRLLNTEAEIEKARGRNAAQLVQYFDRHGVIVIGYRGWRDTTMDALMQCSTFDNNLYWCGRHNKEDAWRALPSDVIDLLSKNRGNAFYVEIGGADQAMVKLHEEMELGNVPRFVTDPLPSLIEQFENLSSYAAIHQRSASKRNAALTKTLQRTVEWLKDVPTILQSSRPTKDTREAVVGKIINDALAAFTNGNFKEAIDGWTKLRSILLRSTSIEVTEQFGLALVNRAEAYWEQFQISGDDNDAIRAIEDYKTVIEGDDFPLDLKARAGIQCGKIHREQSNYIGAIAILTALIEMTDLAPSKQVEAMIERGVTYREQSEYKKAVDDFNNAADMPESQPSQRIRSRIERGIAYQQQGLRENALEEFTFVSNSPDALPGQKARALIQRGILYRDSQRWQDSIDDLNRVIEMHDIENEKRLNARVERGVTYMQSGQMDKVANEFDMVIQKRDVSPVEKAKALIQRGVLCRKNKNWGAALSVFTEVERMSGARPRQRIHAQIQRGITYEQQSRQDRALAEYKKVVESPQASPRQKYRARFRRGVVYRDLKKWSNSILEFTEVVEHGANPVQRVRARFQRGVTYQQMRNIPKAIEDFTVVAAASEAPEMLRENARRKLQHLEG